MVSRKLEVPFWVPIIRIIVFWGLYWGPPILANYHIEEYDSDMRYNPSLFLGLPVSGAC